MGHTTSEPNPTNEHGRPICGARRSNGEICRCTALYPNGRCRVHGGPSRGGPRHPQWKGGGRSKLLPPQLRKRALTALKDPDLLSLREDIAILDARQSELLSRPELGDSFQRWVDLRALLAEYRAAVGRKDVAKMASSIDRMAAVIDSGQAAAQSWFEIRSISQERRKLVETEQRRLTAMAQLMTADQAAALIASVIEAVEQNVTNPEERAAIGDHLLRLLALPEPIAA